MFPALEKGSHSLLHFLTSSSLETSKFRKKTGYKAEVADILMKTVESYNDPLRAMSPPGLIKFAAQPEPERGYLTPGMEAEVAEKHIRSVKSELFLHNT